MNIYEKLSAITAELSAVAKNLQVGEGRTSYKAVGEADVLAAVKPLEAKYKVYSYPCSRKVIDSDIMTVTKTYNGNTTETQKLFMRVETIYRFVDTEKPEDFIEITTYGDGVDSQDKACGKAMTYADKYALLKAYKIITGEDPDQHKSEEGSFEKDTEKPATDSQKKTFMDMCKLKGVDYNEILKQVGVSGKMTKGQYGQAMLILKDMKVEQ